MKHLLSVAVLVMLVPAAACSSLQRQAVGGAVAGVGAATTVAGTYMLDPCSLEQERYRVPCREQSEPRYEREGSQVVAVGLGTMLLGGIIYLTGTHPPQRPKRGEWHFTHPPRP